MSLILLKILEGFISLLIEFEVESYFLSAY